MVPRRPLVFAAASAIALVLGCHGSSRDGTPAGTYCHASVAGETVCYGYSNLTSEEKTAVSEACTESLQGTLTDACPSGMLGCCTTTSGPYETSECYYLGSASSLEAACTASAGKWSAQLSGGSGSGSSSSAAGGSGSGTRSGSGSGNGGSGSGSSSPVPPGPGGTCSAGLTDCPKGCVDESSDPNNCGSCGYACPPGQNGTSPTCSGGQCKYSCANPGETLCGADPNDPTNGHCVDVRSDPENCGQCYNTCSSPFGGTGSCQGGSCQVTCGDGEAYCSNQCISVQADPSNCGGCGVTCGPNTVCTNGACVTGCAPGETLCNGVCSDLGSDPMNCGSCGNACTEWNAICGGGTCTCAVSCFDDLDNMPYCCPSGQNCYNGNLCM